MSELQRVSLRFGWSFPGQNSTGSLEHARDQVRAGMEKLRESQSLARLAREHLLEAVTLDDINEEMEDELRRLLAQIGEFLNRHVIP